MQTHELKRKTKRIMSRQVGRGGKRGKTSGRGTKGMLARAGFKRRPEIRDIIKKLPKLRGYGKSGPLKSFQGNVMPISLDALSAVFKDGDTVTVKALFNRGVIQKRNGKYPRVKILASGDMTKKITLSGCAVSKGAKTKIEKAGGVIK